MFVKPSSPKNDFHDQLLLLTDMSPEKKLKIQKDNDSVNKRQQLNFRSQKKPIDS